MKLFSPFVMTLFLTPLLIAGCSSHKEPVADLPELEQTGPIWGDGAEAKEEYIDAARFSTQPTTVGTIYYSASPAQGMVVDSPAFAQGRINVTVLDKNGKKIPIVQSKGDYYIQSVKGEKYTLYFENISNTGYEVIVTADGIDSVTGKDGSYRNPGYILFPGNTITVRGFRQTKSEYKPFVFYEKKALISKVAVRGQMQTLVS
ncbi:hypothetical protein DKL61_11880 [Gammaproteobacteria bacterium ESL0073]|nr:hypothetical protein DKL61_11880 [Gammaproteobacteria bacterium ESL0073]